MDDDLERIEVAVIGSREPVVLYGSKRKDPKPSRIDELERRIADLERRVNYTRTDARATAYQVAQQMARLLR